MLTTEARPLDAAGRPRSPATMPGYRAARPPRNNGIRYPTDPPRVEEIIAVMRKAGMGVHGARVRGLIVVLWRAGLRSSEALDLAERDLDPGRGALLVRHGKGGKRREVGMDDWGWEQLRPWSLLAPSCRSGRSSVSSTVRPVGDLGRAPLHERSSAASHSRPASDVASLPTSFAMPTPSRWLEKESR